MQAVQHTLLQTRHAGTDETGDALFRSPDADLRSLGGNQTSVGIDMVGSENDKIHQTEKYVLKLIPYISYQKSNQSFLSANSL